MKVNMMNIYVTTDYLNNYSVEYININRYK